MSQTALQSEPPLKGVTVVEAVSAACPLALRLAIGLAGRIAADLGARVVMLESRDGCPMRDLAPKTRNGDSAVFTFLAAGKRSATDHGAVAARLLAGADAVLADTERSDVPEAPPLRVLLSMFAVGATTTVIPWPQSEFTVMALGGLLDMVGEPNHPPMRLGGHQLAYAAGLAAYAGLVAGLLRRPSREVARVALLDVAVWLNWKSPIGVARMGTLASRLGRDSEWPVLRCADGHVALVYQPADWAALCRLCADARLDDPRFADPGARRLHATALADVLEAALGHLTRQQLQDRAMALRLPLGPVWTIDDLRSDPQMLARAFLTQAHGIPRLPVLWNGMAFPTGAPPARAMEDGA